MGLVVAVQRSNRISAGEVFGQGVVDVALFSDSVGKGAHFTEGALACLFEVAAKGCFVLEPVGLLTLVRGLVVGV